MAVKGARPAGLSINEVANELGLSHDFVAHLIAARTLPAIKIPGSGRRAGRIIILREDLDKAIESWRTTRAAS